MTSTSWEKVLQGADDLLTRRRVRHYSVIFLAVWVASFLASIVLGHPPRDVFDKPILPDYLAHWMGGRLLLLEGAGPQLYDLPTQMLLQNQTVGEHRLMIWYINPPFVALFYLPFAALPYLPSAALWTVFTVCALLLSARLLRPLAPRLSRQSWELVLLVAAATPPVLELLASGQDSALSLLLWAAGIRLALARRDEAAGLVFALGLFKPQLFFLPPLLFLCRRRLRALLVWLLTASLLGGLSFLLVGPEGIRAWLALLVSQPYREAIQAGQAWKMQTIPALLTAAAPGQFASAAEAFGLILGVLLVAAFIDQAMRFRGTGVAPEAVLWSLACLTTLLASPHLALYDLVLLFPAALTAIEQGNGRRVRLVLAAILFLNWTLGPRHILVSGLPWPVSALGAAWSAVPLFLLWRGLVRLAPAGRGSASPGRGSARHEVAPQARPSGVPSGPPIAFQ